MGLRVRLHAPIIVVLAAHGDVMMATVMVPVVADAPGPVPPDVLARARTCAQLAARVVVATAALALAVLDVAQAAPETALTTIPALVTATVPAMDRVPMDVPVTALVPALVPAAGIVQASALAPAA